MLIQNQDLCYDLYRNSKRIVKLPGIKSVECIQWTNHEIPF